MLYRDLSQSEYLKLSKLLDEALEMASKTRSAWLAQVACSDPQTASVLREMFASRKPFTRSDFWRRPIYCVGS